MLEGCVGAFMLALGVYGLVRADRHNREVDVSAGMSATFDQGGSMECIKFNTMPSNLTERDGQLNRDIEATSRSDQAAHCRAPTAIPS